MSYSAIIDRSVYIYLRFFLEIYFLQKSCTRYITVCFRFNVKIGRIFTYPFKWKSSVFWSGLSWYQYVTSLDFEGYLRAKRRLLKVVNWCNEHYINLSCCVQELNSLHNWILYLLIVYGSEPLPSERGMVGQFDHNMTELFMPPMCLDFVQMVQRN